MPSYAPKEAVSARLEVTRRTLVGRLQLIARQHADPGTAKELARLQKWINREMRAIVGSLFKRSRGPPNFPRDSKIAPDRRPPYEW